MNDFMTLKDTVGDMLSNDHDKRFMAEYNQLNIRIASLKSLLTKYKNGELDFEPKCSQELLEFQLKAMEDYKTALNERITIEFD